MPYDFAILGSRGYPSTYGGFETFVRRLAPYLADCGDRVTVYGRGSRFTETLHDGVRCITTPGLSANALTTLSHGFTAAAHACRSRYDAVLVLNVANGFFLPMLKRAGVRTVVNPDGLEWERGKWNTVGKSVFRQGADLTAALADHLVVDSLEIGRVWRETFRRESTYIPYGADLRRRPLDTSRLAGVDVSPGGYVLAVARLVPENNVDLLLDALEFVPSDVPVVIVGSANKPTALTARLEALARTRARFRWLGHVSDQDLLADLWAHAGVYFHGHSVGGTNPALLQALGNGAPTLALDTPYNREVLRVDEQLFGTDPRQLAARIVTLLDQPLQQARMRRHGHQVVAARYDWDTVVADYRHTLARAAFRVRGHQVDDLDPLLRGSRSRVPA